jgi:hypothetical protein
MNTYPFLVHAVFIIETVQTLLTGADSSYWFISGFGNLERLQRAFLAPVDRSILNLFVSIAVRSFFCYRIWDIKKSLFWWCCVIQAVSPTWYLYAEVGSMSTIASAFLAIFCSVHWEHG